MYYTLSIITGIIISIMVTINGFLTNQYGAYTATVFIHATGLALVTAGLILKRKKLLKPRSPLPLYFFSGGIIGIGTALFNNLAFGKISVSAIISLGLLGQCIFSFLIDQFGLFGMKKISVHPKKIVGIFVILCGIIVMVTI